VTLEAQRGDAKGEAAHCLLLGDAALRPLFSPAAFVLPPQAVMLSPLRLGFGFCGRISSATVGKMQESTARDLVMSLVDQQMCDRKIRQQQFRTSHLFVGIAHRTQRHLAAFQSLLVPKLQPRNALDGGSCLLWTTNEAGASVAVRSRAGAPEREPSGPQPDRQRCPGGWISRDTVD
jgi:hypothetical protein